MARRRRPSSSSRSPRRPQWLTTMMSLVSIVNALTRVVSLFRRRSRAAPREVERPQRQQTSRRAAPEPADAPSAAGSDGGIPDLFRQRRGDVVVTASGRIVKVLPDDLDDSDGSGQHQCFLVELLDRDRTTVKLAHNLKFGRVPARDGTIVTFRGEYEYTDKGGTIHWTHHDPKEWHEDGWVEIDGKRYG